MKLKFYETVSGETTMSLDQTVNERISEGWQPHGSPYTSNSGALFQAMVLDEETAEKSKNEIQAEIRAALSESGGTLTRLQQS